MGVTRHDDARALELLAVLGQGDDHMLALEVRLDLAPRQGGEEAVGRLEQDREAQWVVPVGAERRPGQIQDVEQQRAGVGVRLRAAVGLIGHAQRARSHAGEFSPADGATVVDRALDGDALEPGRVGPGRDRRRRVPVAGEARRRGRRRADGERGDGGGRGEDGGAEQGGARAET